MWCKLCTFPLKQMARDWESATEFQVASIAASGVAPPPAGATIGDLIERYEDLVPAKGR